MQSCQPSDHARCKSQRARRVPLLALGAGLLLVVATVLALGSSPARAEAGQPSAYGAQAPVTIDSAGMNNSPDSRKSRTPRPTATDTPVPPPATWTPASTSTVVTTVTPSATATQPPAQSHLYGVLGQGGLGEQIDTSLLQQQYAAGVRLRLVHLGWDVLQPGGPADWSSGATSQFQQRIDAFVGQGPDVKIVLDLGLHYSPGWIAQIDPLVDQYGTPWQPGFGQGGMNVYWSPTVRQHVANYIGRVFTNLDFRGRLWAVRVGPFQGELLYPDVANAGRNRSFWAFDQYAQAQSPVPGWRPGDPSPNGEAQTFYHWYVDNLAGTFDFFLAEIRRYYSGYVAPVTPGQGIWDGTAGQLIGSNLDDPTMSHYGTGNYWQRIFAQLPGAGSGVLNWCSSLGDGSGNDGSANWWEWSSGKQMAHLARQSGREIYGENPGGNPYDTSSGADVRTTMQWIASTMHDNGYLGLIWVSQADMGNPLYASLDQYRYTISQHP